MLVCLFSFDDLLLLKLSGALDSLVIIAQPILFRSPPLLSGDLLLLVHLAILALSDDLLLLKLSEGALDSLVNMSSTHSSFSGLSDALPLLCPDEDAFLTKINLTELTKDASEANSICAPSFGWALSEDQVKGEAGSRCFWKGIKLL
jgi:hypothetical protein